MQIDGEIRIFDPMENLEEKAGKLLNAKWYIHFSIFTSLFLILGAVAFIAAGKQIPFLTITIISSVFGLMFTGMFWVGKEGRTFFIEADRIESMIRSNEDSNTVIKDLYKLKQLSFARQTGDRLNELAKMAEVKYDVTILKK